MIIELKNMGIKARSEVPVEICYNGQKISDQGFGIDLLVNDTIVVELKSVGQVQDVHKKNC